MIIPSAQPLQNYITNDSDTSGSREEAMLGRYELSSLFSFIQVRLFPDRRQRLSRVKTLVCSFDLWRLCSIALTSTWFERTAHILLLHHSTFFFLTSANLIVTSASLCHSLFQWSFRSPSVLCLFDSETFIWLKSRSQICFWPNLNYILKRVLKWDFHLPRCFSCKCVCAGGNLWKLL